jgi:hypothetical protein
VARYPERRKKATGRIAVNILPPAHTTLELRSGEDTKTMSVNVIRVSRRPFAVAALAACAFGLTAFLAPARGGDFVEPIDLVAPPSYTPGTTINVQVQTTGAPSEVHIYSNPPGAVSYDGSISTASATIPVATDPNTSGDVTIYFSTGGQQVVAETTEAADVAESPE